MRDMRRNLPFLAAFFDRINRVLLNRKFVLVPYHVNPVNPVKNSGDKPEDSSFKASFARPQAKHLALPSTLMSLLSAEN
jgi:hypothetical protein